MKCITFAYYICMEKVILFVIILLESIILSVQDLKTKTVSESIIFLGVFLTICIQFFFFKGEGIIFCFSGVISGLFYLAIYKITKKMGKGDVYFGIFQGCCLLPQFLWICYIIETILALLINLSAEKKQKIPFIPYMSAGLVGAFVFSVLQL